MSRPWWHVSQTAPRATDGRGGGSGDLPQRPSSREYEWTAGLATAGAVLGWVLAVVLASPPGFVISACVVVLVIAVVTLACVAASRPRDEGGREAGPRRGVDTPAASERHDRGPKLSREQTRQDGASGWWTAQSGTAPQAPPATVAAASSRAPTSRTLTVDPTNYAAAAWRREPQCPTCGHHVGRLEASHHGRHRFSCRNGCSSWTWDEGATWPEVVVVPNLARRSELRAAARTPKAASPVDEEGT